MQAPEKPKRRMVVYVTEEVYATLQTIAESENRSVSNVAEGKILTGLRAGLHQTGSGRAVTSLSEQARIGREPEELKNSVINVLDNLPDEKLSILAEKLSRIINRAGPVRPVTNQKNLVQTTPIMESSKNVEQLLSDYSTEKKKRVQEVAAKLSEFIQKNNLSQRKFRKEYGIDITSLRFWLTGERGMSVEMLSKIEKIISTDPGSV